MHTTITVTHGVSVFTANEWFIAMFAEEFFNISNSSVHLAFHIASAIVFSVPENAFIMNEARRVCLAEVFGHIKDIFATVRFITARPDDYTCMVFIAFEHGFCSIDDDIMPSWIIVWYSVCIFTHFTFYHPATMCFHICFIDYI